MGFQGVQLYNPEVLFDYYIGYEYREPVWNAIITFCCVVWSIGIAWLVYRSFNPAPKKVKKQRKALKTS